MASPPSGLVSPQLAEAALGKERRKRTTEGKALSSASLPPPFPLTQSGGGPKSTSKRQRRGNGFWPRPDMAEGKRGLWGCERNISATGEREGKGESRLFSPIRLFVETVHVSRVNFPQGEGKGLRTRQRLKRRNLLSRRPRLRLEIERGRAYILVCQFPTPLQPG